LDRPTVHCLATRQDWCCYRLPVAGTPVHRHLGTTALSQGGFAAGYSGVLAALRQGTTEADLVLGTEEHLTKRYGWRGLSCIAEARVDPSKAEGVNDSNVKKKIQQAKNAGVQIIAVDGEMPDQMKVEIEKHIKEWGDNRKGTQMHITDVRPWDDPKHRRYFYAKAKDDTVSASDAQGVSQLTLCRSWDCSSWHNLPQNTASRSSGRCNSLALREVPRNTCCPKP
jgi:hypothetical protein